MKNFEKMLASMDNTDIVWLMATLDEFIPTISAEYVRPEYKHRQDIVILALLALRQDVAESNLPAYVLHDDPEA